MPAISSVDIGRDRRSLQKSLAVRFDESDGALELFDGISRESVAPLISYIINLTRSDFARSVQRLQNDIRHPKSSSFDDGLKRGDESCALYRAPRRWIVRSARCYQSAASPPHFNVEQGAARSTYSNSAQTGAWSEGSFPLRISRSIPAAAHFFASASLAKIASMRSPRFFGNESIR